MRSTYSKKDYFRQVLGTYIYVDKKQTVFVPLWYLARQKPRLVTLVYINSVCSTCFKQLIRNLHVVAPFYRSFLNSQFD